MRLVAFCEAPADFRIASDLVDRVLREADPSWVGDVMDAAPEGIRVWHGELGQTFFVIKELTVHVDRLEARVQHGHFDGRPGAADIMTGRNAAAIVRALLKRGHDIDAAVLVRDMDDQPDRRAGLEQARTEARSWARFGIVLGCPDPKREAWVLCGFEPDGDGEQARLGEIRRELGFSPHVDAHKLTAKDDLAKRSAKRVLRALTMGDVAREESCWKKTPLDTLHARGELTGLRAYLIELEQQLVPLLRRG
jgi:hypothetical protein